MFAVAIAGCAPAGAAPDDEGSTSESALDQTPRGRLLRDLQATMESGRFLFGQERFNITGVNPDGTQWLASGTPLDRSDAATLTGSHPAVLGVDVWDFAIKPTNWTPSPPLNAHAVREVLAQNGVVTMAWHMRGCNSSDTSGTGFEGKGNEGCLCKLANDQAFARKFLDDDKLRRFADTLEREGLADAPIILRPLHENTASWFWWGPEYWNCAGQPITGSEAYKTVFRRIVDYLRDERGLDNLLVAYATDTLDDASTPDDQESLYLRAYPGDSYVDVLGIDLYYRWWSISQSNVTDRYTGYLELVTRLARERGKIAALTETGNMRLAWELQPSWSRWFSEELLPMLRDNDRVALAYAMTWENRTNSTESFYVPYPGHPGEADFVEFFHDDSTLFLDDLRDGMAQAANGAPWCGSCSSDPDGDGWGWEAKRSCRIAPDCG